METVFLALFLFGTLFTVVSVLLGVTGLQLGHVHGSGHPAGAVHVGGHDVHGATHVGLHHDAGGHAPGHDSQSGALPLLNGSSILAFVTWFGAAGYVGLRFADLAVPLALAIAAVVGAGGSLLVARFLKLVLAGEREMNPAEYQLEGTIARVTSRIPAGGAGEIIFSMGGRRRSEAARSATGNAVARDTEVVILDYQRGVASVQPWAEFVEQNGIPARDA